MSIENDAVKLQIAAMQIRIDRLSKLLADSTNDQEDLVDMSNLFLECLERIILRKCVDPIKDARETLAAVRMIAIQRSVPVS